MLDKSMLGQRYACHECGTKYYDLNRPNPKCPECEADPAEAPIRDISALLSKGTVGRNVDNTSSDDNDSDNDNDDFDDVDNMDDMDDMDDDMGGFGDLDMDDED